MRGPRWLLLLAIAAILGGIVFTYRAQKRSAAAHAPAKPKELPDDLHSSAQLWHWVETDAKTGHVRADITAEDFREVKDSSRVDLKGMKPWQRANAGIRIVQAKRNVFRNVTGKEMLLLAGASGRDMHESLPLHRLVSKLSGGQRQQLALTASQRRGLACIYIYDEPFSMLDIRAIGEFRSLFLPDPRYAVLVTIPSN